MAKRGTTGAKEAIVSAAVRLFNESGTAAVSTNHIAEGAGVSPGNLYYHFRNKEEIIRAVFDRVEVLWRESYVMPRDREPGLADLRFMVEETFAGIQKYRFFYRELGALTRRDPELGHRFRALRERGVLGTEALLREFLRAGVLRGPRDDLGITRLAKTLMLIAEFWLPFEENGPADSDPASIAEGVGVMLQVLEPYRSGHEVWALSVRERS